MKYILLLFVLQLTGCSALLNSEQLYYDANKSISKDQTIVQSACLATIGEIAKNGDNTVKIEAIRLAEKCKTETIKIEPPKKTWLGF